jgi:hypothetical protein
MRTPSRLAAAFGLAAATALVGACAPENGTGFYALGSIRATVTDATGTPTTTGFEFAQQSRIDPSLPAGSTTGFTGTCQLGTTGRTVHITQVGPANDTNGLTEFSLTLPSWEQDTCTNCDHGSVALTIGGATFSGADVRGGSTPSACTFTTQRRGSFGMQLDATCTGLGATADPRHVDLHTTLTLDGCDSPSTNGM